MKNINKTAVFSALGVAFFIFVFVPYLTNLLMFVRPFSWLVPTGIAINNDWIGYIATYFGATIGGLISGLFTYLGVKKTLVAQKEKDYEEHNRTQRAILELQEVYGAELYLRNIKDKTGRLIITPQYKYATNLNLFDSHFNYIRFKNSGPGKIFNCHIKVEIEYDLSQELHSTEVKVPVIFEGENIYVPIDKISGENNELLNNKIFFIKNIFAEYETLTKEVIRIIREQNKDRIGIDKYSIKYHSKKEFVTLYEIEGSKNEWFFLDDIK